MADSNPAPPGGASDETPALAFCARRPVAPARQDYLSSLLLSAVGASRAAYPQIALDPVRFAAHLAAVIDARDEPLAAMGLLRAPQLWLACACLAQDRAALVILEERHLARGPQHVARVDRAPAFSDEITQLLRAHLLVAEPGRAPGFSGYSGRGELDGWLRVLALRFAQRLRRSRDGQGSALCDDGADPLGPGDPERDHLRLRHAADYQAALSSALASLSTRERLLLKLHYVDGLNIDAIGRLYQLHRSTVARRLAEHRRRLLEQTRAALRQRLRLSDAEFDSLLLVVRSQLALSLRGALR